MKTKSRMILSMLLSIVTMIMLTGCGNKNETDKKIETAKTKIEYMCWGSSIEKNAQEEMIKNFNKKHSDMQVTMQHVPGLNYDAKMATLVISNSAPDVANLEDQMFDFAKGGKLLELNELINNDKEFSEDAVFDKCKYYLDDKLVGLSNAVETVQMFYNKNLFKKAGIDCPPAEAAKAWTWNEFVEAAKKLTIDRNGKHPGEEGFESKNIRQYGVFFGTDYYQYLPMLWSNGGGIATADGKDTLLDKPESIEAVRKLVDLVYKHHVSPSLSQRKAMPGIDIILLTGQVAMVVGGQWSMLDLNKSNVPFGVGVLPKNKKAVTLAIGSPIVIFDSTENPEKAWEFYKYHFYVENVPSLYQKGLWMPVLKEYYTDTELMKTWIDNPSHPKEYKTAVVDYLLNSSIPSPCFNLKNWPKISTELASGMDNIWLGNESPETGLPKLANKIRPLLQGRYSNTTEKVSL